MSASVLTTNPDILNHLEQTRHAEPEAPIAPVQVHPERRYIFRTKPGANDNLMLRIPGFVEGDFRNKEDRQIEAMRKTELKNYGADQLVRFDLLADINGGRLIQFKPLGFLKGSVFQTDSVDLADYIREYVGHTHGDKYVKGLYEDFGSAMIRSRYTDQLFPNTEDGREALGQYDLRFEADQAKSERLGRVDRDGSTGQFTKKK